MRNAMNVAASSLSLSLLFLFIGTGWAQQQQQTTTPAPAEQTPPQAPPPIKAQPAEPYLTGDGASITLQYWMVTAHPSIVSGSLNTSANAPNLHDIGKSKPSAPGFVVSVPAGKNNTIRVSYFQLQGTGNLVAPQAATIFGSDYNQGDYLATNYKIQNAKMSLDYLSWPFPVHNARFHLKTLWEIQATWMRTSVDAPLRTGAVDSSGNAIQTSGMVSHWFLYPSFGLGFDYLVSKNFRIETRASGFAFPHRSTIWDAEGSLNYRVGHFEVMAGGRAFHFRTSPKAVEYYTATLSGAYVGLRFYPFLPKK
ncbi:MAG: hypothetical protein U0Q18_35165 [Bryobacteraceae bacterium]